MNPTIKGLSIGSGAGIGTQLGELVLYLLESGMEKSFPDNIDAAIVGLVTAAAGFLMYRLLPSSPPPASNADSGT